MDRIETPLAGSPGSREPRQGNAASSDPPSRPVTSTDTFSAPTPSSSHFAQVINPVVKPKQEIVPMDLHHPILREFPEHRETIRSLKGSNEQFRSAFEEYHRLDDEIYRIEEDIEFATDQEIEELKMRRAK